MSYKVTNIQMSLEPDEFAIDRDREHLGFSQSEMWDCIEKMQEDAKKILESLALIFPNKPTPEEVANAVEGELEKGLIATNCFELIYDESDEWYEAEEVND